MSSHVGFCCDLFHISEWKFVGEGNTSIAFTLNPFRDSSRSCPTCRRDCNFSPNSHVILKFVRCFSHKIDYSLEVQKDYICNIILPWFSSAYVNPILDSVVISKNFCINLLKSVDSNKLRSTIDEYELILSSWVMASIEPDLHFISRLGQMREIVSVEVKVKSGLRSICPFVHHENKIKYELSRFDLMFMYKHKFRSDYDPSLLCSQDDNLCSRALFALMKNNLKYFRVRDFSNTFFGHSAMLQLDKFARNSLKINNEHFTKDLLSSIFKSEPVLLKLQTLQGLDFLDVEGIHHVYQHFRKLLSNLEITNTEEFFYEHISHPIDCALLSSLSSHVNQFRVKNGNFSHQCQSKFYHTMIPDKYAFLIDYVNNHLLGSSFANDETMKLEDILVWINNLSIDNCCTLIQLWLTALCAKDASVILSLSIKDICQIEEESTVYSISNLSLQSCTHPGVVEVIRKLKSGESSIINVHYKLGITDIAPKPISKICSKYKSENGICKTVTSVLNEKC